MPDYAQIAYEAYAEHQEWKNDQGSPIPSWDVVRQDIKDAWGAAISTVLICTPSPPSGRCPMYVCSVCSDYLPYVRGCEQAHAGICHDCFDLSFSGNPLEASPHDPPTYEAQRAAYTTAMEAYHQRFVEDT